MILIEKKSPKNNKCYIGLTRGDSDILTENKKATKQMQALSLVDRECIFYVKECLAGQTMIRKNKSW